jgi:hypothetical protein
MHLTEKQEHALIAIGDDPGNTSGKVAKRAAVSRTVVASLLADELVERGPSRTGRGWGLYPSVKGYDVLMAPELDNN